MKYLIVLFAVFAVVLAEAPAEEPKDTSAAKEKRGIYGSGYGYGLPYYGGFGDYGYHGYGFGSYPYHGFGYGGYHAPLAYSKPIVPYHAPVISKSVVLPSYHVPYKFSSYHAPYYPYFH